MSKNFGEKIVAWRKANSCTQSALAGRFGISRSFLCQLEKGSRNPTLKTIMSFATELNISADELIGTQVCNNEFTLLWCGTHVDNNGQYDVFRKVRT